VTRQTKRHRPTTVPPEAGDAPAGHLVNLSETTVLKAGNVYSVTERDGSLRLGEAHPLGVFRDDCRFVCGHQWTVNGERPLQLVASSARGSEAVHELTNPPLQLPDGGVLPLQGLQLRFERRLGREQRFEECLVVRSYVRRPVELEVALALRADFLPMLAIRGIVDVDEPAPVVEPVRGGLRFSVLGLDGVHRAVTVTADPPPEADARAGALRFAVALEPGGERTLNLTYELHEAEETPPAPGGDGRVPRDAAASAEAWLASHTTVSTDDELFDRVLRRSLLDLRMLTSFHDGQAYYAAGIPWYATLFGRDSLITAIETLPFDPVMAEGTLRLLAAHLGRRDDPEHDEEPGKVLHELRVGEIARRNLSPLARYYGTVDATPLFLCLLVEHADWSGRLDLFRELRGEVERMLAWIDGPGDRNGDGLLEYQARTPNGLRNQGWKDSDDGIVADDGMPLEPPITLIEPQGYVLRAKRGLARLMALDGDALGAAQLEREATELEARLERFWVPERGHYAMALGPDGRPSGALGSNQGHLLWAGAVTPERAQAIRDALMSDRMFSGWGIRTLAEDEPAYNPVGYHLGTVWPHDTAMIAFGLRKYGFDDDFAQIFEALLEAASNSDGYRLPELFAGFSRTEFETPVPYPVACQPQAWAAGAIPYLVTCGLGLVPDGLRRRLRVRRPSLPRWLNRVEVRGLRIGGARVDLWFERSSAGEQVALTDARIDGDVEVVLEISGSREPSAGRH
jgi:glycogen debranching enzyme